MILNKPQGFGIRNYATTYLELDSNSKDDWFLFLQGLNDLFLIVLVYVENIIIIGSVLSTIDTFIFDLHLKFSLKNLSVLHYFWVYRLHVMIKAYVFLSINTSMIYWHILVWKRPNLFPFIWLLARNLANMMECLCIALLNIGKLCALFNIPF